MSSFTTPLEVRVLDSFKFEVTSEFKYYTNNGMEYSIPVGFITDFASVPRVFWSVLPPHGKYAKAAVLHDYLYTYGIGTKKFADEIFYEAMIVLGVNPRVAKIMHCAVKIFGKGKYV